jgi:hypothetical protein
MAVVPVVPVQKAPFVFGGSPVLDLDIVCGLHGAFW